MHKGKEERANGALGREGANPCLDLAFFAAFFIVWATCAKLFWYSPVNDLLVAHLGRFGTDVALRTINVTVWLGFAAAYLRVTGQRHLLSHLGLTCHTPKGLLVGALVGLAFVAKDLARVLLLEGRDPDFGSLGFALFLAPFVEEVVFRGIVLQQATRYTTFLRANALSGALFVAVHLPGWTFAGYSPAAILSSASFVFMLALLLGYLLKRTKSLWACVVVHAMSNWGTTF